MAVDPSLQKNLNGEVHEWYRTILGYPDHLVKELLKRFKVQSGQLVLDPFCGAGTTLVECMKVGVHSIGIDANPSSCFSARVKTNWQIDPERLIELVEVIERKLGKYINRAIAHKSDPTYEYLDQSGMLKRKWISQKPLRKTIALKNCIDDLATTRPYRDALKLALIAEVTHGASNVKFGPELYCGPVKRDAKVFTNFKSKIAKMAADLRVVKAINFGVATVALGDSRKRQTFANLCKPGSIPFLICSPPYPTEHDYTRNSRLELAYLEEVVDLKSLRAIKKTMVRSHTKGIYRRDRDERLVDGNDLITDLVSQIEPKILGKTHGFAKLYPKVVREYFGGMKRHLQSVKPFLSAGALCAYVVGDQSSYLQVHIPTAKILSQIADEIGYETMEIQHWRSRWSTTTSREVHENILILRPRQ
ncbi:MAG: DNA methyltransferase [Candidatus Acidiferrales bacterium]